jgi:uncharacterized membrane protein
MDHLTIPLLFLFYYGCFLKKWWIVAASSILLPLVKEPYALTTIFCGIYLGLRWRKIALGSFICLFGSVYFYVVNFIVIPYYSVGYTLGIENEAFSWIGETPLEMLAFISTHPTEIFKEIISNSGKTLYLLALFGGLLFIPILSPIELIPIIPILGISLLSRLENYYGVSHHYTASLIAPMLIAFSIGYPKVESGFIKIASKFTDKKKSEYIFFWFVIIWMFIAHILISPSPISRLFWSNKTWAYGVETYIPEARNQLIDEAIKKFIPVDTDVAVSSQNTLNCGHLAHREYYFAFPVGAIESAKIVDCYDKERKTKEIFAEYVLLDLKRPWYIGDQGCGFQNGQAITLSDIDINRLGINKNPGPLKWLSCTSQKFRERFINIIVETKIQFETIYEYDGFMILKRKK